jgi:hypothetical protein
MGVSLLALMIMSNSPLRSVRNAVLRVFRDGKRRLGIIRLPL